MYYRKLRIKESAIIASFINIITVYRKKKENEIVYHSKDINFSIQVSVHISFFNSDLKISDFCFLWRCI